MLTDCGSEFCGGSDRREYEQHNAVRVHIRPLERRIITFEVLKAKQVEQSKEG